jgi:hypothetical protein
MFLLEFIWNKSVVLFVSEKNLALRGLNLIKFNAEYLHYTLYLKQTLRSIGVNLLMLHMCCQKYTRYLIEKHET